VNSVDYQVKLLENYLKENNISFVKIIVKDEHVCVKLTHTNYIEWSTITSKYLEEHHIVKVKEFINKIVFAVQKEKWLINREKDKLNALLTKIDKV